MALIVCPECRHKFSTYAQTCPRCGFPLRAVTPLSDNDQLTALNASAGFAESGCMQRKKKKKGFIAVVAILLVIASLIACAAAFIIQKQKMETDEKAKQESIRQESLAEQERLEQERLKARAEYITDLNDFSKKVAVGNYLAAYVCFTTKNVWYDSIYREYDEETVAYTQTNGKFHDDFNESINKLYDSAEITDAISQIIDNRKLVADLYKSLMHPEPEFEDCFRAVEEVYSVYFGLTGLAISPGGSLNSYTEKYLDYYDQVFVCHDNLLLLIPEE